MTDLPVSVCCPAGHVFSTTVRRRSARCPGTAGHPCGATVYVRADGTQRQITATGDTEPTAASEPAQAAPVAAPHPARRPHRQAVLVDQDDVPAGIAEPSAQDAGGAVGQQATRTRHTPEPRSQPAPSRPTPAPAPPPGETRRRPILRIASYERSDPDESAPAVAPGADSPQPATSTPRPTPSARRDSHRSRPSLRQRYRAVRLRWEQAKGPVTPYGELY